MISIRIQRIQTYNECVCMMHVWPMLRHTNEPPLELQFYHQASEKKKHNNTQRIVGSTHWKQKNSFEWGDFTLLQANMNTSCQPYSCVHHSKSFTCENTKRCTLCVSMYAWESFEKQENFSSVTTTTSIIHRPDTLTHAYSHVWKSNSFSEYVKLFRFCSCVLCICIECTWPKRSDTIPIPHMCIEPRGVVLKYFRLALSTFFFLCWCCSLTTRCFPMKKQMTNSHVVGIFVEKRGNIPSGFINHGWVFGCSHVVVDREWLMPAAFHFIAYIHRTHSYENSRT